MAKAAQPSMFQHEAAPGAMLLLAACVSMGLANSPMAPGFAALLATPLGFAGLGFDLLEPLSFWIKDGLMAVFFFYVGLELKREFVDGELRSLRAAALPLAGALGGMLAPAAIFVALNHGSSETLRGWGIPMATDIAFALGVLSLLSKRVPPALKAFLLALAIIDDLGAIVVIAVFYGHGLQPVASGCALALFLAALAMNRLGLVKIWPYAVLALPLWIAMHFSGVHASVAGVALAFTIPYRIPASIGLAEPPLLKLEHGLREWVMFAIMPIFALANAGVTLAGIGPRDLLEPLTAGVALGLLLGKPLGIVLAAGLAARMLRTPMPGSLTAMGGLGLIAGIGFTMSLFVGALAFSAPHHLAQMRLGVYGGSILAALGGLFVLRLSLRPGKFTDAAARAPVEPFLVEDEVEKP